MIPPELFRQIRRLEIYTNRLVTSVLAGDYHSVFKGQGLEFEQVREYEPGDDVRTIDWNVTARMNRPFVKQYVEERELTVLFLVDVSASAYFGTAHQLKRELATEFCAAMAFSALRNNDRVGLLLFTDQVEKVIGPRKGRQHVLRLIRDLLFFEPTGRGTDVGAALDYAGKMLTRRSTLFLVSDFFAPDFDRPLRRARARHDVIAVTMADPREQELPNVGLLELWDPETQERALVDTASWRVRRDYQQRTQAHRDRLRDQFARAQVDTIHLVTNASSVKPLLDFFRRRKQRLRQG